LFVYTGEGWEGYRIFEKQWVGWMMRKFFAGDYFVLYITQNMAVGVVGSNKINQGRKYEHQAAVFQVLGQGEAGAGWGGGAMASAALSFAGCGSGGLRTAQPRSRLSQSFLALDRAG
jgi:hypothetical protein